MCVSIPHKALVGWKQKGNYKIKGEKSYKCGRRNSKTPTKSERLGKGLPSVPGVPSSTAGRTKWRLADEHCVGVRVYVVGCELLSFGMRRDVPWLRNSTKFMTAITTKLMMM